MDFTFILTRASVHYVANEGAAISTGLGTCQFTETLESAACRVELAMLLCTNENLRYMLSSHQCILPCKRFDHLKRLITPRYCKRAILRNIGSESSQGSVLNLDICCPATGQRGTRL
jgi:hypothetical protein